MKIWVSGVLRKSDLMGPGIYRKGVHNAYVRSYVSVIVQTEMTTHLRLWVKLIVDPYNLPDSKLQIR